MLPACGNPTATEEIASEPSPSESTTSESTIENTSPDGGENTSPPEKAVETTPEAQVENTTPDGGEETSLPEKAVETTPEAQVETTPEANPEVSPEPTVESTPKEQDPNANAQVTGTVQGQSLATNDAPFFTENMGITTIKITNIKNLCSMGPNGGPISGPYTDLTIMIQGSPQTQTYNVVTAPAPNGAFALFSWSDGSGGSGQLAADSGNLELLAVTAQSSIQGKFKIVFGQDTIEGTFTMPYCSPSP